MRSYQRKESNFSLCGLNCCLCPRFHTEGTSKCPGCGGEKFSEQHPTCAVVTCALKHGAVEFCFECTAYPCERYKKTSQTDSFITYAGVPRDMLAASEDLEAYLAELSAKKRILDDLIEHYNDGRSKGFYCLAVNLLPLSALNAAMDHADPTCKSIKDALKDKAKGLNIELCLRKE